LVTSSETLISIVLLNAANEPVVSAGEPVESKDILQAGEQRWGPRTVMLVNPVDLGARLASEGATNPTVVLASPFTNNSPDGFRRGFPRREPRQDEGASSNILAGTITNLVSAVSNNLTTASVNESNRSSREGRPRGRPFWLRNMDEKEYQTLVEKRALHGLLLVMSTESFRNACTRDLWLRSIIAVLATVSVAGSGMAWRNLAKSSDLQLRLVRASEMNTHLKEMNLAAAGLAHETRNPLNIIRGLAQMISKGPDAPAEIPKQSRDILNETDKVTAQLNEFINYSRPREVRRSVLAVGSVVGEVVRALNYDLEEKKIAVQLKGDQFNIEADEQLLRQALFNLLLNAVQAADGAGEIQVVAEKRGASEALLEVRDNGPGVAADHRDEIFKPYFTTQKTGTGLGLAVVQQIVLAHGWEIECLPNTPKGAIFRITHLKVAA
jgi:signal transduction histidine kinase